ncbi:uncharacterized protein LOC122014451 [Zingiber officinale]|uniref:uncharacterized protein LOC122014451 n=1 Tax=Zingiber officinale TaxID=94328 RepID=UPI001C4D8A6C|nr:uncharacterized protein LOC122014451 [Zingiber officinale]
MKTSQKLYLLQLLVRDCLPEESGPTPVLSDLSFIISKIKTVDLLSEQLPNPSNTKLVEAWRAAMDAWLERVISLTSSKMPDKCWVGVSLLGVTCGKCSSARFITSYSVWFQKLLSIIQLPPNSSFVRVAVCTSLSDLFTRLTLFSNLKKVGIAFAGKVIPPIIKLLNENGSDVVLEGVLTLLCTILKLFPSLHGLYDNVQAALVAKIVPSSSNADLSKKIANCLALLPMAKIDEDSWSLMMQQIIMEIDILLNYSLQGLEGEMRSSSIVRLLIPPGRHPPSPLGILSSLNKVSEQSTKRFLKLVVPTIVTLMQCCCMMLTNPYPIQVIVPISPLVALVQRVLMVDGSSHVSLTGFTTIIDKDLVCHDPTLHLGGMDLLIALIEGVKSQLIPHAATIARILMEYSKREILPSQRIKLYSVESLLISMGAGITLYLAQELINNASADLNDHSGSNTYISYQHLSIEFDQAMTQNDLSIKTAALKALEALLIAGGPLKSKAWRSETDFLLITVARNAFDMRWANGGNSSTVELESTTSRLDFLLTALSALLISLKSTSHVRPPHLCEALEIFHRGKLEGGAVLAAMCGVALLDLENLIHPRALPLINTEDSILKACKQRYHGNTFYGGYPNSETSTFSIGNIGATNNMDDNNNDEDELLNGWLRSDKEERPVQFSNTNGEPSRKYVAGTNGPSKDIDMDGPSKVEEVNVQTIVTGDENKASDESDVAVHVVPMETDNNNLMVSNIINGEHPSSSGAPEILGRVSKNTIMVDTWKSLDVPDMGKQLQIGTASTENVRDKQRELAPMYDSDSISLDSLPGIVDADPDSE